VRFPSGRCSLGTPKSRATYYESLVDSNPVRRSPEVDASGLVHATNGPGIGYEEAWAVAGPPAVLEHLITEVIG
jgi:hypothetical protein